MTSDQPTNMCQRYVCTDCTWPCTLIFTEGGLEQPTLCPHGVRDQCDWQLRETEKVNAETNNNPRPLRSLALTESCIEIICSAASKRDVSNMEMVWTQGKTAYYEYHEGPIGIKARITPKKTIIGIESDTISITHVDIIDLTQNIVELSFDGGLMKIPIVEKLDPVKFRGYFS